jgi:hypothetical protein
MRTPKRMLTKYEMKARMYCVGWVSCFLKCVFMCATVMKVKDAM